MDADQDKDRIVTLDVIRGVAVMGILAMNITGFALPELVYLRPTALGMDTPADLFSWLVDFMLFDGRMRGLFALLFGASMLLVIERAEAAGEDAGRVHFARMAWLLLFGLAHFYLIWWGDILALYAMIGLIAWHFVRRSPGALLQWGILFIAVQTLIEVQGAIDERNFPSSAEETFDANARSFYLYQMGFADIAAFRVGVHLLYPLESLLLNGPETLGYMLIGMAALKSGFITGAWSDAAYRRTIAFGLGIGIPVYAVLATLQIQDEFSPISVRIWNFAATSPVRPIMVAAYAALIILMSRGGGALAARIAATGRAAFSNYLATSLAMTFLFYGWGLGLFGTMGRAQLWLVVLPMWALMMVWSKPWLDRFRYGPLEWLWRSLARGEPQPMRKD